MSFTTFILTQKHKTTYQKPNGTYHDVQVSYRIVPEYTRFDGEGDDLYPVKYRHIRSERTQIQKDQVMPFSPDRDNIRFTNGFCVCHNTHDKATIEFLEKHPMNADQPDTQRRQGVFAVFRKAVPEVEGVSEIDKLMLKDEARKVVMGLAKNIGTKEEPKYEYETAKIDLLSRIYQIDDTKSPSQKIVELEKYASAKPTEFLYLITAATDKVDKDLEMAINLKVITTDKNSAFLNQTLLFKSDKALNEKDMKTKIIAYLLTPAGNDQYNEMNKQTQVAIERKAREKELTTA